MTPLLNLRKRLIFGGFCRVRYEITHQNCLSIDVFRKLQCSAATWNKIFYCCKQRFYHLFGALHEARTLDGIAAVLAPQSVVVVAVVGVVIFVLFPHHSGNANETDKVLVVSDRSINSTQSIGRPA